MKNYFKIIPAFLASFLFLALGVQAGPLDGLWRNDRQNITIRIEEDQDGFRAKRTDQGVWYRYSLKDDYLYVDRYGNTYEILDQNEIEWREASTRKRILFTRADVSNDRKSPRAQDDWYNEDDRIDRAGTGIAGRWYDRQSKERLIIEPANDGYRVRTQNGGWEKYVATNNKQIRSRSGDVIQLVDRNTIRWRSVDDRHVYTMTRQANNRPERDNNRPQRDNSDFRDHDDDYDYRHNGKHSGKHPNHNGKHKGKNSNSRGHKN